MFLLTQMICVFPQTNFTDNSTLFACHSTLPESTVTFDGSSDQSQLATSPGHSQLPSSLPPSLSLPPLSPSPSLSSSSSPPLPSASFPLAASGPNTPEPGPCLEAEIRRLDATRAYYTWLYTVVYELYVSGVFFYLLPYALIPILNLQLLVAIKQRRDETRRISLKNQHQVGTGGSHPTRTSLFVFSLE